MCGTGDMLKNHTVYGLGWSLNFFYIELNLRIVCEIDQVRAMCLLCKEVNVLSVRRKIKDCGKHDYLISMTEEKN